jgi:hypothetical protein
MVCRHAMLAMRQVVLACGPGAHGRSRTISPLAASQRCEVLLNLELDLLGNDSEKLQLTRFP